ncbi:MAG TPA: thiamine phosphate synthase [Gammaproteobacteria bacterium]|jgi:thiamine-phosphate pyrophosphorylase|nr:thiamine phosphate synthase [Gammaproteobacteria bacterium]
MQGTSNTEQLSGLYAITDCSANDSGLLFKQVESALDAGLRLLQYRNKNADANLLLTQAKTLRKLCHQYAAQLIINDNIELAKIIHADGVHLGRDDPSIHLARQQLGKQAIVGVSCYNSLPLAFDAQHQGASYVAFGSFFASPTKPEAVPASPELLESWREQPTPACAIGGITLNNAANLTRHGADMLAVISDLWRSENIHQQTRDYLSLF